MSKGLSVDLLTSAAQGIETALGTLCSVIAALDVPIGEMGNPTPQAIVRRKLEEEFSYLDLHAAELVEIGSSVLGEIGGADCPHKIGESIVVAAHASAVLQAMYNLLREIGGNSEIERLLDEISGQLSEISFGELEAPLPEVVVQ